MRHTNQLVVEFQFDDGWAESAYCQDYEVQHHSESAYSPFARRRGTGIGLVRIRFSDHQSSGLIKKLIIGGGCRVAIHRGDGVEFRHRGVVSHVACEERRDFGFQDAIYSMELSCYGDVLTSYDKHGFEVPKKKCELQEAADEFTEHLLGALQHDIECMLEQQKETEDGCTD